LIMLSEHVKIGETYLFSKSGALVTIKESAGPDLWHSVKEDGKGLIVPSVGLSFPEPERPECELMKSVQETSQVIGEFIEWLEEVGLEINYPDGFRETTTEKLLARFFGIDLDKVDREKRELLAWIRAEESGDLKGERAELGLTV